MRIQAQSVVCGSKPNQELEYADPRPIRSMWIQISSSLAAMLGSSAVAAAMAIPRHTLDTQTRGVETSIGLCSAQGYAESIALLQKGVMDVDTAALSKMPITDTDVAKV